MKKRTAVTLIAVVAAAVTFGVIAIGAAMNFEPNATDSSAGSAATEIPGVLQQSFPNTDWSQADPAISRALSGGPPKDGIPAINEPQFEPVADFAHPDEVQAILVQGETETKAYPYNILIWHEIVNDTIDGIAIAVTFCPLCGSASVFDSVLADGATTTFGVSGGLLESNMIMFDRNTETLWQQSTGMALAGENYPHQLELHGFQLLTIGEIKDRYPQALVLSEETGHSRDYGNNPYAGYEDSGDFYFAPSHVDDRYPAKTIFVAFSIGDTHVASPWLQLEDGREYRTTVDGQAITIEKSDGELQITGPGAVEVPFYFEMWFSWAVQNEDGEVFDPETVSSR